MSAIAELNASISAYDAEAKSIQSDLDRALGTIEVKDGVLDLSDPAKAAAMRDLVKRGKEVKEMASVLKDWKALQEWGGAATGGAPFYGAGPAQAEAKTLGSAFTESDEFKGLVASGRATMDAPFHINGVDMGAKWIGNTEVKDVYSAMPSGPITSLGPVQRDAMVPRQYRKARVRDLFPVQRTSAALIEYFRMTGFTTNNAAPVAERTSNAFTLKPQTTIAITSAQAPVRTIAHWEAAHRNVLDDVPQLRGMIDNELLYGLRLEEDDQILNGDGTGENLLGILETPGVQTYNGNTAEQAEPTDTPADDIRRAITLVSLAYYEATGVVVHPLDWEDIELTKDSTGQYVVAVAVAIGAETRLWRVPVVDSPAMAEGTFLTGAFGLGAQLYDRMEGTIRVAEQHADFFVRNAVVILAEQRLALAVKRPESFVVGTFTGAS